MNGKQWTQKEIEIIREHYPDAELEVLLEMLPGRTVKSIYCRAKILGVKRSDEFVDTHMRRFKRGENPGIAYWFPKGHVPLNKGKKMTEDVKKKVQHTFFKKGHKPRNEKPDGAISIRKDNRGIRYKYIRISKGNWVQLHRFIWEQNNGAIPVGKLIRFKDGDSMNCTIENLEMISVKENMKRNTRHNYPPEINQMIAVKGGFKRRLNNIIKSIQNQNNDKN